MSVQRGASGGDSGHGGKGSERTAAQDAAPDCSLALKSGKLFSLTELSQQELLVPDKQDEV